MSGTSDWWKNVVAVVVLFVLGAVVGHLLTSTSDADRAAWEARVDSTLTVERERHQAEIARLRSQMAADSAAADSARRAGEAASRDADRARGSASAARASADSLLAALGGLAALPDSVGRLVGALQEADSAREVEAAALRRRIAADSTRLLAMGRLVARGDSVAGAQALRIARLEGDLEARPGPDRWRLRLWGLDIRPGAAAIYTPGGDAAVGVGLLVTP
jgi:hypothetical protein